MSSEKTVVNMSLLIWCAVVIAELIVIAYLINSGFVLLFMAVLISPILAAFKWPAPQKQLVNAEVKAEVTNEKAE
ncbi:MAG: hypothetical protein II961_04755 [Candidatus Riflebacteria bacterium]|nr:hypothetical protein [Candidatus Riflebacteria bacterium]